MTEPEPTTWGDDAYNTATYPDVDMKPGPPKLPEHIEAYYQIKRRALIMQIGALNKLLGIDKGNIRI